MKIGRIIDTVDNSKFISIDSPNCGLWLCGLHNTQIDSISKWSVTIEVMRNDQPQTSL